MKGCVQWPFFSILLNGTLKGFFSSSRGLRQGDPLCPFLFSFIVNGLSAFLVRAERARLIKRFTVGERHQLATHLQIVDDTILFLKENESNIRNMKICLQIFGGISGPKVNMSKSCMVGINMEEGVGSWQRRLDVSWGHGP